MRSRLIHQSQHSVLNDFFFLIVKMMLAHIVVFAYRYFVVAIITSVLMFMGLFVIFIAYFAGTTIRSQGTGSRVNSKLDLKIKHLERFFHYAVIYTLSYGFQFFGSN